MFNSPVGTKPVSTFNIKIGTAAKVSSSSKSLKMNKSVTFAPQNAKQIYQLIWFTFNKVQF